MWHICFGLGEQELKVKFHCTFFCIWEIDICSNKPFRYFLRDQVVIFVVEILRRQAQHFILVIEVQRQAQQKWDIWKAWKAQKLLSEWEKLMFRRNFFGDIIELNKHYFKHNFIQLAIDVSQHKDKPFHFDQLVNF